MTALETSLKSSAIASGLVTPSQLEYVSRLARHRMTLEGLSADEIISDRVLADLLVEQQMLTRYQADQLCAGRTKLSLGPYLITDWIGEGGMGRVYKAVDRYKTSHAFSTYIYRIATNLAISELRKRKRRRLVSLTGFFQGKEGADQIGRASCRERV